MSGEGLVVYKDDERYIEYRGFGSFSVWFYKLSTIGLWFEYLNLNWCFEFKVWVRFLNLKIINLMLEVLNLKLDAKFEFKTLEMNLKKELWIQIYDFSLKILSP